MKQLLPPVPYSTPLTGPGSVLTAPWIGFLKQLSKGWLNVRGTDSNDSADDGYIGEFISANPAVGVAVAASGAYKNITSISLTPGEWDVTGTIVLNSGTGTVFTVIAGGVSLSSGTTDSKAMGGFTELTFTGGLVYGCLSPRRVSIAAATTVYLVGLASYTTAGTASWTTDSFIRARRVR